MAAKRLGIVVAVLIATPEGLQMVATELGVKVETGDCVRLDAAGRIGAVEARPAADRDRNRQQAEQVFLSLTAAAAAGLEPIVPSTS